MKLVGKVKDAHGLRGDLYVLIFSGDVSWADHLKTFQLQAESASEFKSFNVKKIKPNKKGIIISSPEILDRTQAEALKGSLFFISEELLISKKGETIFLSEILNFSLISEKNEILGHISGFSSNGSQDLLIVKNQSGEHMVPFVAPWIVDLNFKNQTLQMNLPPGLLGD
ncbi:MAG: ribosome maturation factor RimM [Bdellovibrionota bacterium]